jgi:integrase
MPYLRAACRYAHKHHGLGDGNINIAMPAVSNERQHYVTRREMLEIARKCENRHARALIRIGFYSGMRPGEMMKVGDTNQVTPYGFLLLENDRFPHTKMQKAAFQRLLRTT